MAHAQSAPPMQAGANRKARRRAARRDAKTARQIENTTPSATQSASPRLDDALLLIRAARLDDAETLLRESIATASGTAAAHNLLAKLLDQRGRAAEAYQHHKQAVGLDPQNALFWSDFGQCLMLLLQDDAAVVACQRAVALRPDSPDLALRLGRAQSAAGRIEDALHAFDQAISLAPGLALAHCGRGSQLQYLGDFDGAATAFERALALDPDMDEALFNLIQIGRWPRDPDGTIARLDAVAATPDLPAQRHATVLFALARLHERRHDHDRAFACYRAANERLKSEIRFDHGEGDTFLADTIEGFTGETFEALGSAGQASDRLVFIVGMPRSGTTLVETIIASHPDAYAGGEIRKFALLVQELAGASTATVRYPRDAARMDPTQLSEIGRLYLAHVDGLAPPEAARVTDKLPFNFLHLGLIATLFPDASIINCRRDPIDTCLSCYFQRFNEPGAIRFSNDLETLGRVYRLYDKLMDHWRSVLPVPILDVDYEEVVRNQDAMARRILEFVGLDRHNAHADSHEAGRGVKTASAWQVRQPIYTSSIGKWRRYEKHLGPLVDALAASP